MLRIEVWSDIACPWCWLGKHHLQAALERSGLRDDVEIEFRSYELAPGLKAPMPVREYLGVRYGVTDWIDDANARLRTMGEQVGIRYDLERAVAANTFDAHRIHHLAKARGLGNVVVERLMRARQGEAADVSDHPTLRALAVEAGLDGAEVDEVLSSDRYADAVRTDEREARALGVSGVPFFVFDRKFAVSGAQPVEVFEEVLERVREAAIAEP